MRLELGYGVGDEICEQNFSLEAWGWLGGRLGLKCANQTRIKYAAEGGLSKQLPSKSCLCQQESCF